MTWDELFKILQIASGVVAALTFAIGVATIWAGIKSGDEKDAKAKQQEERIEELRKQNLVTEERLEKERLNRVELETAVARRVIGDQLTFASRIKHLTGMNVILISVNDFEAKYTASHIAGVFGLAGWNARFTVTQNDDLYFFEGIKVESTAGSRPPNDFSREAAYMLVDELENRNVDAQTFPSENALPLNTIRVIVGLKPMTFFLSPEMKEQLKRQKESAKKLRTEVLESIKESRKTVEEIERATKKP